MDFVQKFNTQLEERDKLFRLVQYATRLLWALKDRPGNKAQVQQLKSIEDAISLSRQMLRFGKCLESINSSLYSIHLQDSFLRTTITLSRIANGLYLLCDNLVWLSKIGVLQLDEDRTSVLASSYWLYSTIMLLAKNIYQMYLIFQNQPRYFECGNYLREHSVREKSYSTAKQIVDFALYNKALTMEVLKNLCDTGISLNASNKVRFSPLTIGLIGVISSLIPILKHKTLGLR